ncbi:MAG: saccharopine dehydrogenase family protein [Acidimicrobiia bacterium]
MRTPAGDDEIVVSVIGTGVVGGRTVRHLVSGLSTGRVMIHDIRPEAAQAVARASGARAVAGELDQALDAGVVVIATPEPQLELATEALRRGAHVVTTTDQLDDVDLLMQLAPRARVAARTVVLCANLTPGLAGLLARMLAERLDVADEIHVAVHGTGGPACARQHHRALGGTGLAWHDGEWIERQAGSGRELCWFPDPIGPRDCYRSEMVDPFVLHAIFPDVERISARMSATRRDRLTARLPMLRPPHQEGTVGGLRVEVRGSRDGAREALVLGVAERAGTASAIVAGSVALALHDGMIDIPGVVALGDHHLPTELLVDRLRAAGIAVDEFVGSGLTGSTW